VKTPTRASARSSGLRSSLRASSHDLRSSSHERRPAGPVLAVNLHNKARTTPWPPSSDEDGSDEEDAGARPLKAPRGKPRARPETRKEEEPVTGKRRVRFQKEMFPPKLESSIDMEDGEEERDDSGDSPASGAPSPDWSAAVTKMEGRQRSGVKTKMKQWASKGVAAVHLLFFFFITLEPRVKPSTLNPEPLNPRTINPQP